MQEFGSKIGWARIGLYISALLLLVFGILCFAAPGIMPEALHSPTLPDGYLWPAGEIIGAIIILFTGVCLAAAWGKAGGLKVTSGWLIIDAVVAFCGFLAAALDPAIGTFSFEWVIAVFIAFMGLASFLGAVCGARILHYKGWLIEMLLGIVMVVAAIGCLLNSANSDIMAGISFICLAIIVAMVPFFGKDMKLVRSFNK